MQKSQCERPLWLASSAYRSTSASSCSRLTTGPTRTIKGLKWNLFIIKHWVYHAYCRVLGRTFWDSLTFCQKRFTWTHRYEVSSQPWRLGAFFQRPKVRGQALMKIKQRLGSPGSEGLLGERKEKESPGLDLWALFWEQVLFGWLSMAKDKVFCLTQSTFVQRHLSRRSAAKPIKVYS